MYVILLWVVETTNELTYISIDKMNFITEVRYMPRCGYSVTVTVRPRLSVTLIHCGQNHYGIKLVPSTSNILNCSKKPARSWGS